MGTDWGPFSLGGRRALITGGAMGIGFGIAQRFVEAGARVLIVDRDAAAAARAAERLGGAPIAAALALDVADADAGDRMVARCREVFGGLDVLVNDAGIFPRVPVLELARADFDRVIAVNLAGLVFACKAAAQQMIAQGGDGKIVNIGSIDSVHPSMVGLAAYDASKGGLRMFGRSLALELAPHRIHVNAIFPGGVTTEGTSRPLEGSGMTPAQAREVLERFVATKVPLARMGVPDDIAKAAVFLASSASDYMTGSEVVVDGGALLA